MTKSQDKGGNYIQFTLKILILERCKEIGNKVKGFVGKTHTNYTRGVAAGKLLGGPSLVTMTS